MAERSYPRMTGQPLLDVMTDENWKSITLGVGGGILDQGGLPYWYGNINNNAQTLDIQRSRTRGDARSLFMGFYHELYDYDWTIYLPMPSTTTTYKIGLIFNPTSITDPAALPVSLGMWTGSPSYTQGREYLAYWEITRQPNQILSNATFRQVRPKISPRVTVATRTELEALDARNALWGSTVRLSGTQEEFAALGSSEETGAPTRWESITDPPWVESTSQVHVWAGHGPRPGWRRVGNRIELQGHVQRALAGGTRPAYTQPNTYTLIPNAPSPVTNRRVHVWGGGLYPEPVLGLCNYDAPPLFHPKGSMTWIDLGGATYPLD